MRRAETDVWTWGFCKMKEGIYSLLLHAALFLVSRPLDFWPAAPRPPQAPVQVQLISAVQVLGRAEAGSGPRPPAAEGHERPVFPPETGVDPSNLLQTGPIGEVGMRKVEAEGPPSPPKSRRPKNINGPEDCLLKVVAQVCPAADLKCMADYHAFCATLPTTR